MLTNVVAPDKLGGLERYVRELAGVLSTDGVSVTVISKATSKNQPRTQVLDDGVVVRRFTPPEKSDPLFAAKYPLSTYGGVRQALSAARHDAPADPLRVIHGHFPVPMIPLLLHRRRFLYTCHAPVFKEISAERQATYVLPGPTEALAIAGVRTLEKQIVQRAQRVITLSKFIGEEVSMLDRRAASRTIQIPGGIDLGRFSPSDRSTPPRTLPSNAPIVFAARRLVQRTGVEQLVDAFAIAARRGPAMNLVLAGDGPRRRAIEQSIIDRGLGSSVLMLGRVSDEELLAWYRACDVAVTPTQELEGFGLSTAEAMACGAVPLVTPVGANPEVVAGLPSYLVTADSTPAAIADGLTALLKQSPASRSELRRLAIASAQKFGWTYVRDRHIATYDSLAADALSRGDHQ